MAQRLLAFSAARRSTRCRGRMPCARFMAGRTASTPKALSARPPRCAPGLSRATRRARAAATALAACSDDELIQLGAPGAISAVRSGHTCSQPTCSCSTSTTPGSIMTWAAWEPCRAAWWIVRGYLQLGPRTAVMSEAPPGGAGGPGEGRVRARASRIVCLRVAGSLVCARLETPWRRSTSSRPR